MFSSELREIFKNIPCISLTDDCFCRFLVVLKNFQNLLFKKKISTKAFRLDNSVKPMVFCDLQTIVGEFPLEYKNDNNNNNDNNDGKKSSNVYEAADKRSFSFQPKCVIFT